MGQHTIDSDVERVERVRSHGRRVLPSDERTGTIIFSGFLMALGIFWVFASSDLPNRQQTAYLSQGFMPITGGIMLAVLSAMTILVTLRTRPVPPDTRARDRLFEPREQLKAVAVFVVLLAYIIILPRIHYLISTFLLLAVGLRLAGEPLRPRLFVIAAVMALVFFGVFVSALQLPLPGSKFG